PRRGGRPHAGALKRERAADYHRHLGRRPATGRPVAEERSDMTAREKIAAASQAVGESVGVFLRDVGQGMLEVSHNMLALLGLAVVAVSWFGAGRADMRLAAEQQVFDWLQARQEARTEPDVDSVADLNEPSAVARATAAGPKELPRQQAAVANWLSRKYRVAP